MVFVTIATLRDFLILFSDSYFSFFLEMEVYPRPLHHNDACSHLIKKFLKYHKVIKVLQLASGAKERKIHSDNHNRYGNIKDKIPRLLSCYATAIRTG